MFGFDLEADEWLTLAGLVLVIARVVWRVAVVVWQFVTDTAFSPPTERSAFRTVAPILLSLLVFWIGFFSIAIGLASMLSGALRANHFPAYIAFGVAPGWVAGLYFSIFLMFWERRLTLWLYSFRIPQYREQLASGNAEWRLAAANRLEHLGTHVRPAWKELLEGMLDESPDVCAACERAVLNAYPEGPPSEDLDTPLAARKALAHPDLRVRTTAAAILLQWRVAVPEEVLPKLIEGVASDQQAVMPALKALTLLGPVAAPACLALRDAVRKEADAAANGSDLQFALQNAQKMNTPGYVPPDSYCDALRAIGAEAVPVLLEIVERGDVYSIQSAVYALGKIGEPARGALPMLQKLAVTNTRQKWLAKQAIRRIKRSIRTGS